MAMTSGITWHLDFKFALTVIGLLLANLVGGTIGGTVIVTSLQHRLDILERAKPPITTEKFNALSNRMIRVELQGATNGKALERIDRTVSRMSRSSRYRRYRTPGGPTLGPKP